MTGSDVRIAITPAGHLNKIRRFRVDKKKAKQYLRGREFYSDKEGIEEFLAAWRRIRAKNPDIEESALLDAIDLNNDSQWDFFPE